MTYQPHPGVTWTNGVHKLHGVTAHTLQGNYGHQIWMHLLHNVVAEIYSLTSRNLMQNFDPNSTWRKEVAWTNKWTNFSVHVGRTEPTKTMIPLRHKCRGYNVFHSSLAQHVCPEWGSNSLPLAPESDALTISCALPFNVFMTLYIRRLTASEQSGVTSDFLLC